MDVEHETRTQKGSVTFTVGGHTETVPVDLVITETKHADGRIDCIVRVPVLKAGAKTGKE